jgi:3-hydroxymyristoyl/3-hydroxydecanoyl-(acyl carrier protein) dehydratase
MADAGDHFAAYSFVDRIDEWNPGRHARAQFLVPAHLHDFSSSFVSEAVGQLAAWVSMDFIDFRGRPVAALASETRYLGNAIPGRTLDLEVDLASCDDEAVAYSGRASLSGQVIVELIDCLGPMLPVAEFDDPAALRERLALLRGKGATPGRFRGVTAPPVAIVENQPGERLLAILDVPTDAPFFHDHFPRRPVFPATLLLDSEIRLALDLASQAPWAHGNMPLPERVTHVKMRSWIVPGQRLEIEIVQNRPEKGVARAMLNARTDGRTLASARLEVAAP